MFAHRVMRSIGLALVALGLLTAATPAEERRDTTMAASSAIMARLYAAQPALRALMPHSAGYITVANAASAEGSAMAVLWRTRQEAFMRFENPMPADAQPQAQVDLVLIFPSRPTLGDFLFKGRTLPGGVGAPQAPDGKVSPYPGAIWVAPGIWAYVLDGERIVNDRPVPAARFHKDDELN